MTSSLSLSLLLPLFSEGYLKVSPCWHEPLEKPSHYPHRRDAGPPRPRTRPIALRSGRRDTLSSLLILFPPPPRSTPLGESVPPSYISIPTATPSSNSFDERARSARRANTLSPRLTPASALRNTSVRSERGGGGRSDGRGYAYS